MIAFGTDNQTLQDLNIFSQARGDVSVFDFYNFTKTKGGKDALENLMRNPLNDLNEINGRLSAIKFIDDNKLACGLDKESLDFIEFYLNQNTTILRDNYIDSLFSFLSFKIKPRNEYYVISRGIDYLRIHLNLLSDFFDTINNPDLPPFFTQLKNEISNFKNDSRFRLFIKNKKINFRQISHFDFLIRKKEKDKVKLILNLSYLLDAYFSVAQASKTYNFCFPQLVEEPKPGLKIEGFFHPFLDSPVKNDIEMVGGKNLCFVSGANMAGKSTFLKSVGLCVYLAHIGFPVPAKSMKSTVFNGIFSTINISDNINKGYSHYYSEVKRVKEIALVIKEKKKVFVIFDELFRGTNVKDAHDATLLVSKGFTQIKNSIFFISTHIVEVGAELEKQELVLFKCFESSLQGGQPVYDYKLVNGISKERLGLTILKNEGVLEILEEINLEG